MGIDDKIINALRDGYEKATFYTEDDFGKSEKKTTLGHQAGLPPIPIPVSHCHDSDVP